MRILVFEFVTGGGLSEQPLDPELVAEGEVMLHALVSDLVELPDVEVVTTRDPRLAQPDLPCEVVYLNRKQPWPVALARLLSGVDAAWPIAPETDRVLEQVSNVILLAQRILLNSRPEAIRITASKRATSRLLNQRGIRAAAVYTPAPELFAYHDVWVLKPDDGVGCLGSRICHKPVELMDALAEHDGRTTLIAQPYIEGVPLSLSLLCRDGRARVLSCNSQRVAVINDSFRLLGCVANYRPAGDALDPTLTDGIALAVTGLWGYIGVDLILTKDGPQVLEINPRLTLSYVGLRRALSLNPAGLVLDLLDQDLPIGASGPPHPGTLSVEVEAGHHVR